MKYSLKNGCIQCLAFVIIIFLVESSLSAQGVISYDQYSRESAIYSSYSSSEDFSKRVHIDIPIVGDVLEVVVGAVLTFYDTVVSIFSTGSSGEGIVQKVDNKSNEQLVDEKAQKIKIPQKPLKLKLPKETIKQVDDKYRKKIQETLSLYNQKKVKKDSIIDLKSSNSMYAQVDGTCKEYLEERSALGDINLHVNLDNISQFLECSKVVAEKGKNNSYMVRARLGGIGDPANDGNVPFKRGSFFANIALQSLFGNDTIIAFLGGRYGVYKVCPSRVKGNILLTLGLLNVDTGVGVKIYENKESKLKLSAAASVVTQLSFMQKHFANDFNNIEGTVGLKADLSDYYAKAYVTLEPNRRFNMSYNQQWKELTVRMKEVGAEVGWHATKSKYDPEVTVFYKKYDENESWAGLQIQAKPFSDLSLSLVGSTLLDSNYSYQDSFDSYCVEFGAKYQMSENCDVGANITYNKNENESYGAYIFAEYLFPKLKNPSASIRFGYVQLPSQKTPYSVYYAGKEKTSIYESSYKQFIEKASQKIHSVKDLTGFAAYWLGQLGSGHYDHSFSYNNYSPREVFARANSKLEAGVCKDMHHAVGFYLQEIIKKKGWRHLDVCYVDTTVAKGKNAVEGHVVVLVRDRRNKQSWVIDWDTVYHFPKTIDITKIKHMYTRGFEDFITTEVDPSSEKTLSRSLSQGASIIYQLQGVQSSKDINDRLFP